MQRARLALALTVVSVFAVGCGSESDLGGGWRVLEKPLLGDKIIYDENSGEPEVGIELLIGHYGPDVAGLVRFYRTNAFQFRRSELKPDSDCACTFMRKGKTAADASSLEFDLEGCVPGSATRSSLLVRATLELDASGQLDGKLTVLDNQSPLKGRSQKWTFKRVATSGAIDSSDLICETPDAKDGNTFNGL